MKITYAYLRGFKRLYLANIKEIEMRFPSAITVIRGISGVGKSSILRELSPLPSVRTAYEKNGKKELHIEHDGHSYVLISDFSNRTSPHSFIVDGIDLNIGHTSSVQEELVVKHFGFTPTIRNLVHCRTKMCSLTKTDRKNLFIGINPTDLTLVLDTFKKSQTKFKECRAQLQLLYDRKVELEGKMISEDVLSQHVRTKKQLEKRASEIDQLIFAINQGLDSLDPKVKTMSDFDLTTVKNVSSAISSEIKSMRRELPKLSEVPRIGQRDKERELERSLATAQSHVDTLKEQSLQLKKEVDEYQQHIQEMENSRSAASLEEEYFGLKTRLEEFKNIPEHPVDPKYFDEYADKLKRILDLIEALTIDGVKIYPPEVLYEKDAELRNSSLELDSATRESNSLQRTIDELAAELVRVTDSNAYPSNCNISVCKIGSLFIKKRLELEQKIKDLHASQQKIKERIAKLTEDVSQRTEFLMPYKTYKLGMKYKELRSLLGSPYFAIDDWDKTLVDRLNTQPYMIHQTLLEHLEGSKQAQERNVLAERLASVEAEIKASAKNNEISYSFMRHKSEETAKKLSDALNSMRTYEDQKVRLQQELNDLHKLQGLKEAASAMSERLDSYELFITELSYYKFYTRKLEELEVERREVASKLYQLSEIVKEQELIRHTYNTEIQSNISKIERNKEVYEKIITALSPNSGIPHKSMIRYINALITNVNKFISQIWTYRLSVKELDPDEPIDYELAAEIGNGVTSDITFLSEGQTEIMNLTWMLTILLQMGKLKQIPLMLDEAGRALDPVHRMRLLNFFNQLLDSNYIEQMFLISHYDEFAKGFADSDVIYIAASDNDVPAGANEHVTITRY